MIGISVVIAETVALVCATVWLFVRIGQEVAADKAKAETARPKRRRTKYKGRFSQ